jgi:hypothetical protein
MNGAGGTDGGIGRFLIGFIMLCVGGYLFFNSVTVSSGFGMGTSLMSTSNLAGSGMAFSLTSGMVLVPFIFGIGMIFYNSKNVVGWLLSIGSLAGLFFGIIVSLKFKMQTMSAYELLTILVLFIGGLGLFLSSLKPVQKKSD